MNLSGNPAIFDLDPYANSNVQQHNLGARGFAPNGDVYRYTRIISTGSDLIAGNLQVASAVAGNHGNRALGVLGSVGDPSIEVAIGGTAVVANEYDGGFVSFNDNSPEGETYEITSHDASSGGSEDITVKIRPDLQTAATTSSQVELIRLPWNNPAISQLITERAAGVSIMDWDVSVANFGWLKTHGVASVLTDSSATTIGYLVTISNETNGAVGALGTIAQEMAVGQALGTPVNGEFNAVYLTID
jgi:hypothetical protein